MAERSRNRQVERPGDATAHPGMIPVVETELLQSERENRDEPFVSHPRPTDDWWFGELAKFALRSRYVETGDEKKNWT